MLSEDSLDNLTQPIIDRQEAINLYIIQKIAKRVNEIGKVKKSDIKRLASLRSSGADVQEINKELAKMTSLQVKDIKALIRVVALTEYLDTKAFFDYRHKKFIPYSKNDMLRRRIESIARQTSNTYINMSKAQAFMIRDLKNPSVLIPTSIAKTYQSIVDEAIQAITGGTVDYNTAMRRTINQLADSGLRRVTYNPESGRRYTQRMDTAVRRNILDGVRKVYQGMQDIVGEQFGADGVEISVHMNPAPDHAAMQGHQYTKAEFANMQNAEDFKDVQGRHYEGFERAVGTLNCRHFAISIVIGATKQNYTDAQLQRILDQNEAGYTMPNGKHLTMYECTQYQRKLETKIRYAKDNQIAARAAGDMTEAKKYQAKINDLTKEYEKFSAACGLSPKKSKMTVKGYHKIKAS